MDVVVDTSALVTVIVGEPDAGSRTTGGEKGGHDPDDSQANSHDNDDTPQRRGGQAAWTARVAFAGWNSQNACVWR